MISNPRSHSILSQCLGQSCLLFSVIKERCLYLNAYYFIMYFVWLSSCIRCFNEYQVIWGRMRLLQRINNSSDSYVVSVIKGREIVGHLPRKISGCVLFLELGDDNIK